VTSLADAVLSLIRTRADLYRWSAANAHGTQMLEAVALLEQAAETDDPATVLAVTQKALASATKVIRRADDSSGIIGDAILGLLALHPQVAARAQPPARKLVDWLVAFQFEDDNDFHLDPAAYGPALGPRGMENYRERLDQIAAGLGPEPPADRWWSSPDVGVRFTLQHNAQRLAVHDRDVEAIIRTHARDRQVAAWLEDTAEALAEIGEIDLAIDWAKQAAGFDHGHQAAKAARYWCELLAAHRPDELLPARLEVFRRWPNSGTAAQVHAATGADWPSYREEVVERLAASPRDAVLFALLTLHDVGFGWELAHSLGLRDADAWSRLVKEYEKLDPLGALPVHRDLVEQDLVEADARGYQLAARRLRRMRSLADGSAEAPAVDAFIRELRELHRRRPRLQQEFDRAGLPKNG
jgi:tetratricopeptide (TPR) repeat protein